MDESRFLPLPDSTSLYYSYVTDPGGARLEGAKRFVEDQKPRPSAASSRSTTRRMRRKATTVRVGRAASPRVRDSGGFRLQTPAF